MASLDEPNGTGGESASTPPEQLDRAALERRVRELEMENARLRAEMAHLTELRKGELLELHAFRSRGLPATEAEWRKMVAEAVPGEKVLGDLIAELEAGNEPAR